MIMRQRRRIQFRSDSHGRFLCGKEALLAQGFPVYSSLSSNVPLCSFALPRRDGNESSRSGMVEQAENAMHAMVCGLALLYAVTQVESEKADCVPEVFGHLLWELTADFGL